MHFKKNVFFNEKNPAHWGKWIAPWVALAHCGRNTHFRQICFAVPNFNFIYIYI